MEVGIDKLVFDTPEATYLIRATSDLDGISKIYVYERAHTNFSVIIASIGEKNGAILPNTLSTSSITAILDKINSATRGTEDEYMADVMETVVR